jgi:CelD/BcsL family acetyltransferase involved in cellulose biosynthesis
MNSDVVLMSRFSLQPSDKTVAYHLGYVDSQNVMWSSLPAYNIEFNSISPGKILLHDLIAEAFKRGIKKFDFGRGSEPYKNWFANDHEIMFNIKTQYCPVKTAPPVWAHPEQLRADPVST